MSSGLTNRALTTPKSMPSAASRFGRLVAGAQERSAGDEHPVGAPVQHFGPAQFDRRDGPRDRFGGGLRIANRHRPVVMQGPVEHRRHVGGVARGHHHQVRHRPQIGQVEHAVVRGAVGADQPGAIEQQRDRQVLQRDFLENLIVAALHEGAVDGDHRPQAGLGQSGGERHRVRFADAHVEELVGKLVADRFEHGALAHGGGDRHDSLVGSHLLEDRVAHQFGVRRPAGGLLQPHDRAVLALEGGGGVEHRGVFGGGLEAVPLLGHHVQQHRARHLREPS